MRLTLVAATVVCVAAQAPYLMVSNPHHNDTDKIKIILNPSIQNIPIAPDQADLRPPPPRVPEKFEHFIAIPSYRDGVRCGFAVWTAFARATDPNRVSIGVVDQTTGDDPKCLDEYCKHAKESWPDVDCKYKDQIQIHPMDAKDSKGPAVARALERAMIGDQEFCMSIDAHTQFVYDWDNLIVEEWKRTENEMAILSHYPLSFDRIGPNNTVPTGSSRHMCMYGTRNAANDIPIQWATDLHNSEKPQMQALWGGGLSFGKCHAEKRVPVDGHLKWVFFGEEFIRAMQLWTHGYDIYSPSVHGAVLLHNYTGDLTGTKPDFFENAKENSAKPLEERRGYNRLRAALKFPFQGEVDAKDMETYYGHPVRTLDEYLAFSKVTNVAPFGLDDWPCEQLRWVPYAVPEIIEELLPGWKMRPATSNQASPLNEKVEQRLDELQALNMSSSLDQVKQQLEDSKAASAKALEQLEARVEDLTQQLRAANESRSIELQLQSKDALTSNEAVAALLQTQLGALANHERNALVVLSVIIVIAAIIVFKVSRTTKPSYAPVAAAE
ncbi:hypothetical protein LEN26_020171 [Aphanomyces euteiches]|nr:hypothetical protein LEN26_020171 [Aphanomyces euteiches]KAH9129495.1 hypothetical protein AeMF1_000472 [Aphanomyces euteiches]KAH9192067.1 hypothetical protein AeNC1_005952 [Aphanomyces euteiches]